jgi:IclR family pca regulon transcriptional regulator
MSSALSSPGSSPLSAGTAPDGVFVQSLERGLAVLRAFSADAPSLTLSEVARRAGVTRATSRRLLHTFEALGYMRSDGRHFELTPKVLDLGYAYLSSLQLPDIAQPFIEQLSERVQESVSVAVLDGAEIVYVARVATKHIMSISLGLGSRLPAASTSMGRVLLAGLSPAALDAVLAGTVIERHTERTIVDPEVLRRELEEVRRRGYALVDQELEDALRSVAVPLRDRQGRVVAALNVGTHTGRVGMRDLRARILPELQATAVAINAQLARR